MAAVTIVSRKTNVAGAKKVKTFIITGATGDTLDTRLKTIDSISVEPSTITAAAKSTVNGRQTITFTASGAFTAESVTVVGN